MCNYHFHSWPTSCGPLPPDTIKRNASTPPSLVAVIHASDPCVWCVCVCPPVVIISLHRFQTSYDAKSIGIT